MAAKHATFRPFAQAMANGFDPVWMETVRIEIARDRIRTQRWPEARREDGTDDNDSYGRDRDDNGDDGVVPANFSIVVWTCFQGEGHRQPQSDKVGALVETHTLSVTMMQESHVVLEQLTWRNDKDGGQGPLGKSARAVA